MKRVLILEDNQNTLRYLEQIVKEIDDRLIVYAMTDDKEACLCMLNHDIDLFIIDIILHTDLPGDTSGLYFAEKMRKIERYMFVPLIFITSLEDSKFISYDQFHCYSFIEKPFEPRRVKEMIEQCLRFQKVPLEEKPIYFKYDGVIFKIESRNIVYIESLDHVLYIHTQDGGVEKIANMTQERFLEAADNDDLIKCRRNIIVNINYIKNVDIQNQIIQLSTGKSVDIGVRYKRKLRDYFENESINLHH